MSLIVRDDSGFISMRSRMIACAAGISMPAMIAAPAGAVPILACLLVFLGSVKLRRFLLCGAFSLGFAWGALYAWAGLAEGLPKLLAGSSQKVCGTITGLPHADPEFTRFHLRLEGEPGSRSFLNALLREPPTVRLNWYDAPSLRAGETLCVHARLKQPKGLSNPGGFDYERYLFARQIRAVGNVRSAGPEVLDGQDAGFSLDAVRDELRTRIRAHLQDSPLGFELIPALVLGDRGAIRTSTRETLQGTGTSHLLAISGLHIGLLAGFCFLVGRWAARIVGLTRFWPAQRIGAAVALAGALGYGLLAGFGIPVQRALIMLACGLLPVLLGHRARSGDIFCLALLLVLLRDPLAIMDPGFWLSFGAVLVLMWSFAGRPAMQGVWWAWGRAQWVLLVGLVPLLAAVNLPVAWLSPLANLLAVPLVGMVIVPLALTGTVLTSVFDPAAAWLFAAATGVLELVWLFLERCGEWGGLWSPAGHDLPRLLLALLGGAWLLMPRGVPARFLGLLFFVPLWLPTNSSPDHGDFEAHVLDVGQGLAVLVHTHEHTLLYDTGIGGSGFDMGTAAIVPTLRRKGMDALDRAVLSHADHDHSGGFGAVARHVEVGDLIANHPVPNQAHFQQSCTSPSGWNWDGVDFEILHPRADSGQSGENNRSCVIRVQGSSWSLLLAGDIERDAEYELLLHHMRGLRSDVLIAPHHGSRTSSAPMFVAAVSPGHVVFSAANPSRFGHPHPEVTERYARAGVQTWNTGREGAIRFRAAKDGDSVVGEAQRALVRRYWHRDAGPYSSVLESARSGYWSEFLREAW